MSRLAHGFLACTPWLLTGALGLWQWDKLNRTGSDLRYVVLSVSVLCAVFTCITLWRVLRAPVPPANVDNEDGES